MKRISFKTVSDILSEKEMKNVLGGSGTCCYVESSGGTGYCYRQPPSGNDEHWECNTSLAYSYCGAVC